MFLHLTLHPFFNRWQPLHTQLQTSNQLKHLNLETRSFIFWVALPGIDNTKEYVIMVATDIVLCFIDEQHASTETNCIVCRFLCKLQARTGQRELLVLDIQSRDVYFCARNLSSGPSSNSSHVSQSSLSTTLQKQAHVMHSESC